MQPWVWCFSIGSNRGIIWAHTRLVPTPFYPELSSDTFSRRERPMYRPLEKGSPADPVVEVVPGR